MKVTYQERIQQLDKKIKEHRKRIEQIAIERSKLSIELLITCA